MSICQTSANCKNTVDEVQELHEDISKMTPSSSFLQIFFPQCFFFSVMSRYMRARKKKDDVTKSRQTKNVRNLETWSMNFVQCQKWWEK